MMKNRFELLPADRADSESMSSARFDTALRVGLNFSGPLDPTRQAAAGGSFPGFAWMETTPAAGIWLDAT